MEQHPDPGCRWASIPSANDEKTPHDRLHRIRRSGSGSIQTFYSEVFGWTFNDYGSDCAGIHSPNGDGESGGLNPHRTAGPGLPLVIIYSDNLDATVEAVRTAGGRVTEEPYEFPGGRRFHFADPGGNELAVWTSP